VVGVDEGNKEGVCDDVLDMEKIVTCTLRTIKGRKEVIIKVKGSTT
jgi:hypothetical protein